jgi:hypothetical protein
VKKKEDFFIVLSIIYLTQIKYQGAITYENIKSLPSYLENKIEVIYIQLNLMISNIDKPFPKQKFRDTIIFLVNSNTGHGELGVDHIQRDGYVV